MTGAAGLCARAAYRAGAGMVRLGIPGGDLADLPVSEAVGAPLPVDGWSSEALVMSERCRALVVGPGLGRAATTVADVRDVVARATVPVVVDADGLYALGTGDEIAAAVPARPDGAPRHRGPRRPCSLPTTESSPVWRERHPGPDRITAASELAARCGAVVLLKGPTTVVADPDRGRVAGHGGLAPLGHRRHR